MRMEPMNHDISLSDSECALLLDALDVADSEGQTRFDLVGHDEERYQALRRKLRSVTYEQMVAGEL